MAISTCNRTEIVLVAGDPVEAESATLAVLAREAEIRPTELLGHLYSWFGRDVVSHLFEVASGLDSMIVGEAEVQGQVKRAYELALVEGATGPISNRLFREALATGKRVRTDTGVSRSRVSVSSVAVELAADMLGDLSQRRVLVVGAGENGELTARALREHGVETVFVANRHYDRAIGLASRFGGGAVRFEELPAELEQADIVVSCTGSPHQIIGREELQMVAEARAGRPLVLIDIAVPRDIDPSVRELPGIALYDMDDLQRAVARNLSAREAEATPGAHAGGGRRGALRGLPGPARRAAHGGRPARARRSDRAAGAARERAPLGVGLRGRPRADGGDGALDREPAAARAHAAAEGRGGRGGLLPPRAGAARAVRARRHGARGAAAPPR